MRVLLCRSVNFQAVFCRLCRQYFGNFTHQKFVTYHAINVGSERRNDRNRPWDIMVHGMQAGQRQLPTEDLKRCHFNMRARWAQAEETRLCALQSHGIGKTATADAKPSLAC